MSLIDFTLIPPIFSPERIGKAIASIIPLSVMEQAITETSSQQERERMLPTPVIIFLVMSLNFWSGDSVVDVFKNLVEGFMSELIPQKIRLKIPSSGSISEARQRVGAGVMTRLFHLICQFRATKKTTGAFLNGLRLMSRSWLSI